MKYWDTSALLRAWKEGWIPDNGFTRAHSVAEWFCVQTGPGMVFVDATGKAEKRIMKPALAAKEAQRVFANLTFSDLDGLSVLKALEEAKIAGVEVYDFLHAKVAESVKAEAIVTLNLKHFSKITNLRLEMPSKLSAS